MSFQRQKAENWQTEVPGVRWFKADLQIHTIDDHSGGRAKVPSSLSNLPDSSETLRDYARLFLQSLVNHGIQVAGLTPHSPRMCNSNDSSAVWSIIEEWNNGNDDDEVPFREKIYAVFPGFEPSFNDGADGLHLLLLFDPEIGCENYLKAFDLVMGGVSPWKSSELQISSKSARDGIGELSKFFARELGENDDNPSICDYLVLAPHVDSDKGLLKTKKAQVLQLFDHSAIAGLELGDNKLPADALKDRSWLELGMASHRQAFFHSSDAYRLEEIGQRYSWMKMATPRIESLRQAFIASDSRMRIGFAKDNDGSLHPIKNPPDVNAQDRPWLRELVVLGGASFFSNADTSGQRETRIQFSPDLTCIIGGSMSGKSTLLDGLRVHTNAPLPDDETIRKNVVARGDNFRRGVPKIELDCPGRDTTTPLYNQWPAQYFTQNELQRLSQDSEALEEILSRLDPTETSSIQLRSEELHQLNEGLSELVRQIDRTYERVADAEQAQQRAEAAKKDLARVSKAGVKQLHKASHILQSWETAYQSGSDLRTSLQSAVDAFKNSIDMPIPGNSSARSKEAHSSDTNLAARKGRITEQIEAIIVELDRWNSDVQKVIEDSKQNEANLRISAERALVDQGLDSTKLRMFQELNLQASLLPSFAAALEQARQSQTELEQKFTSQLEERRAVIEKQRAEFDRVASKIKQEYDDRIQVVLVKNGDRKLLDQFIHDLRQKGVTRWWNDLPDSEKPSPEELAERLETKKLKVLGMSSTVQNTFCESMIQSKRRQLTALHCPDRYILKLQMEDGNYRPLEELSGGQRISVLLSLLLGTADYRPLVIDQPEDELDNRFLFETVLPALKELRGRRQVIIATHNANLVVNGDAEMVIQLDSTAHRGWVASAGAIDAPEVRDVIVKTVDGGDEAFRLRRRKYGF